MFQLLILQDKMQMHGDTGTLFSQYWQPQIFILLNNTKTCVDTRSGSIYIYLTPYIWEVRHLLERWALVLKIKLFLVSLMKTMDRSGAHLAFPLPSNSWSQDSFMASHKQCITFELSLFFDRN